MYRIQKSENIQGQIKEIYYEGDYRWNTDFDVRKLYETLTSAQEDLYSFGGEVSADVVGE
jgi:hypothetical protein